MATYYPISASPKESPTSTYPRGPGRVLCTESSLSGNILYTNYSSSDNLAGSSQSPQNAIEHSVPGNILLPGSSMAEMITTHLGGHQYDAWRDGRNELPFMQTASGPVNGTTELVHNNIADHQMGMGMQFNVLNSRNVSLQQSNISAVQGQGLSLSLGTEIPASTFQFHAASSNMSALGSHQTTSGNIELNRKDNSRDKQFHAYPAPYALSNCTSTIPNSKYLKAAQELLEEVVNVRKALKGEMDKSQSLPHSSANANRKESDNGPNSGVPTNPNESASNSTVELSPDERQDLQNKMAKLLAMLDEIDRRYKQYYNQMQIVISSFDVVAGCGAAKPYTALALQTISRHFRCLRDAINEQIQKIRKNLGEDGLSKGGAISRLRYIDQHLKQQRAFQQFGIMQQNAWRPQRGLPENSVSILRAWLFEHFLHPYPKDSDKIMLARQTGLTRSQVSNWFINARVRLWKPMVEEMYKEEIGNGEIDTKSSSENAPTNRDELGISEDKEGNQNSMKSGAERPQSSQLNESSKSNLLPETDLQNGVNAGDTNHINLKARGLHANTENQNHSLLQEALVQGSDGGRLMSYQMAELGRYANSGVSLTLGLQHCDGGIPVSDDQHSFGSLRGDDMFIAAPLGASDATEYNNYMNLADSRHRIGSSQLLHDFVA